jgi:hypothetical protein
MSQAQTSLISTTAVNRRVPKTPFSAGLQVLETARAENAFLGVRKTLDFARRREMRLLWQTWNELPFVEGVGRFEHLTRLDQFGQFVRGPFGLTKNFLAHFLRLKHYDFNKVALRADSIVGIGKRPDNLVSKVSSRRTETRGWSEEQCDVEALPIRAIDDRSCFGKPKKSQSAVSALAGVPLQRDIPSSAE